MMSEMFTVLEICLPYWCNNWLLGKKCVFLDQLAVVPGGCWLLLGKISCEIGAGPKIS